MAKKKKIYLEDTLNAEELANWRWKMSIPMQATILSEEEVAEECQKHKDLLKKQLEAEMMVQKS